MTQTTVERAPQTQTGGGGKDGDGFAHYAQKGRIAEAYVLGTEVVALCGYRWVPSRDPRGLPVCPACKALVGALHGEPRE